MIKGEGKENLLRKDAGHLCQSDDIKVKQLAIRDVIELLSGKWKIQLIGILSFNGKMRFMDLLREVDGIAAKMLSKELRHLEENQLIRRTVVNSRPITVEYEITDYGHTLHHVIREMVDWGVKHRTKIMGGSEQESVSVKP